MREEKCEASFQGQSSLWQASCYFHRVSLDASVHVEVVPRQEKHEEAKEPEHADARLAGRGAGGAGRALGRGGGGQRGVDYIIS